MTRRIVPALALTTALLVSGCGGDDSPRTGGTEASSTTAPGSGSTSSSTSSSTSASTSASASASTPSVSPATGQRVQTDTLSFVVPEGWTGGQGASSSALASADFFSPEKTTNISTFQVANPGKIGLEAAAKIAVENQQGATRVDDRVVGDQPTYAVEAQNSTGRSYTFGRPVGTNIAEISFTFAPPEVTGVPEDLDAQRALVESVLVTVEWAG